MCILRVEASLSRGRLKTWDYTLAKPKENFENLQPKCFFFSFINKTAGNTCLFGLGQRAGSD